MPVNRDKSFDDLVEHFFGKRIPEGMTASFSMSKLSKEAQEFIVRMLALMKRAGYTVTAFNPHLIRWLSATVPSTLPGAWGGRIPPLTLPGRHKKFDTYVAGLQTGPEHEQPIFVDVGCGFPPVTSADTAKKLKQWKIYGVDRTFAAYVLYDENGHYACFDRKGGFQYFQALMNRSGRAFYANPEAARNHFQDLFMDLFPLLERLDETQSETVEKNRNRLIRDHIRDFETDNLTFIETDFADLKLPPVHVVRCMNVLIYFEPETRKKMLEQIGEFLDENGTVITGTNGLGIQSRYAVYRKVAGRLSRDAFAFGLDNIGDIVFMPFFTIHENDPEAMLLADLIGTLRSSRTFWPEFSKRHDELLQERGICKRTSDGFLNFENNEMQTADYLRENALMWWKIEEEGFTDMAVNVLVSAGYQAWKNEVGDIAVRPQALDG